MQAATKTEITGGSSPSTKAEAADLESGPGLRVRAAVLGASGYAARELVAVLARHPGARLARLITPAHGRKQPFPIEQAHPALRGRSSVLCVPLDLGGLSGPEMLAAVGAPDLDVVFLATPHETAHDIVPVLLDAGMRVIDLSGAFRLKDAAIYPRWYGFEHRAAQALAEAVYGLPELDHGSIAHARSGL